MTATSIGGRLQCERSTATTFVDCLRHVKMTMVYFPSFAGPIDNG